jgi:hypothetical protein
MAAAKFLLIALTSLPKGFCGAAPPDIVNMCFIPCAHTSAFIKICCHDLHLHDPEGRSTINVYRFVISVRCST